MDEAGAPSPDPWSIAGKLPAPEESFQTIVVGAGPAGCAAAIAAAIEGASVLLVDENPIPAALFGLDVPLFWGARYDQAVQTPARLVERLFAAQPALEAALEAGVEVRLGVTCFAAFVAGEASAALPGSVVGLADETRSWLAGFEELVVATGARDLALAFAGWDQPGVMGANAFHALATRYDAFAGRRLVILGSGELALSAALAALERGLEVAALVEPQARPLGPPEMLARVTAAGVPVMTGHTVLQALGGADGVTSIRLAPVGGGAPLEIACDTICQAIGLTPMVDLLEAAGARLAFDEALGVFAPVVDAGGRTSLRAVRAVGDVLGGPGADASVRQAWSQALQAVAPDEVMICQCEAVTRRALLAVEHPAYLGPVPPALAARDLARLRADGPVDPDQVKRLTRAGMGPCQGRRCRDQIALLLAEESGAPLGRIPLARHRPPVRPLPLNVLADWTEAEAMSQGWDVWFGIDSQWVPYDKIDEPSAP